MSNANRVCKYHARGACLKGEQCDYSHDRMDPPALASASSSANGSQSLDSDSGTARTTKGKLSWVPKALATLSPFDKHARSLQHKKHRHSKGNGGDVGESSAVIPSEHLFCAFSAAHCPLGDKCSSIHGEQCLYCRKHCLHPTDGKQRENHFNNCEKKENYMKALKDSQEIECNICLEHVLLKAKPAECKFGLLPECDHAFCLSCIKNWVTSSVSTSRMDIIDADLVRTCPVCRKLSSVVIPSDIWYFTEEEKQTIVENYKANCKVIDCKHFKFRNGNCPFGANCFYKHTVKPGWHTRKQSMSLPQHIANNLYMSRSICSLNLI